MCACSAVLSKFALQQKGLAFERKGEGISTGKSFDESGSKNVESESAKDS